MTSRFRVSAVFAVLGLAMVAPAHGAALAGQVTSDGDGAPLSDVRLRVFTAQPLSLVGTTTSQPDGRYTIVVPAGTFVVLADRIDRVAEFFDNVPCDASSCAFDAATRIVLAAADVRSDVNFALAARGLISGVVRADDSGAPLEGVVVDAFTLDGALDATAITGADGRYELRPTLGSRRLLTRNQLGYIDEYHANLACPAGQCNPSAATPVVLTAGASPSVIDFGLLRGARIQGSVQRTGGGPIDDAGVEVRIASADGAVFATVQPDASGAWALLTGLTTGSYRAAAAAGPIYAPRVWNNRPCPADDPEQCALGGGDPIAATAGGTSSGIDFVLPRVAGSLSGRVTRLTNGQGFASVQVSARSSAGAEHLATTDAMGDWRIDLLPAGSYTLEVLPPFGSPERAERWPGLQCETPGLCPTGTPVALGVGEQRENLHFQLAPLALVSVSLSNADTAALMAGELRVRLPSDGREQGFFASTPESIVVPVADGGLLRFSGTGGACGPAGDRACLGVRFPDTPCARLSCTLLEGAGLDVIKGSTASATLSLSAGARIQGRVLETNGTPIDQLELELLDTNGVRLGNEGSFSGDYFFDGLDSGPYFVRTRAPTQFINEIWDNVPCPGGICSQLTGTPIALDPAQVRTGIDFALARGGGLSGRVTREDTGTPLPGASVAIHDAAGIRVATATTAGDGNWLSPILADGLYTVSFDALGFDAELYDNLPCPDLACAPTAGTALQVTAPATVTAVDAALSPRLSSLTPRTLYLNRCAPTGCVLTPGVDDSRLNRSSIVNSTRTLGAFAGGDALFASLTSCMRGAFERYNITLTTTDPGNQPHFELMIAGTPGQLGQPSGILGVAPWIGGGLIPNAIAFVFSGVHGDNLFELCWTSAHEAGHLLGLEHELLADDFMSYFSSQQKLFVDADANCGESLPRPCDFGGSIQNSFRRLGLTVGNQPRVFSDGFEPAAPPSLALRATRVPAQPFACAVDTTRDSLPPALYRLPSGPTVPAAQARRPRQ